MEHKKLIEIIKKQDVSGKGDFFLNNHNGELVNGDQENLLQSNIFSIEFIHDVNKKLLDIQAFWTSYEYITIDRIEFIKRIGVLAQYYMKTQRSQDAEMLGRLTEKIIDLGDKKVTITNKPNLVVLDKELHPDVIRNIPIRRVLRGFTLFRRLFREDVLNQLECACAY